MIQKKSVPRFVPKSVPIFPLFSLFFLILQEMPENAFVSENLCKYLEINRRKAKRS